MQVLLYQRTQFYIYAHIINKKLLLCRFPPRSLSLSLTKYIERKREKKLKSIVYISNNEAKIEKKTSEREKY